MKCVLQALGLQRCHLNFGGKLDLPGGARDRMGGLWTRSIDGTGATVTLQTNRLASPFSATSSPVRRPPSARGTSINKLAWGRLLSNPTRTMASGRFPAAPMVGPAIPLPIAFLLVGPSLEVSMLTSHSTGTKAPLAIQPPTIATNHQSMASLFHNECLRPVARWWGTLVGHFRASSSRNLVRLSHSTCSTGQPSRVGLSWVNNYSIDAFSGLCAT
jgi:hypothetical protein